MHTSHIREVKGLFCVIGAERRGERKLKRMLWLIAISKQQSTLRIRTYQLVLQRKLGYNVVLTRGALAAWEL